MKSLGLDLRMVRHTGIGTYLQGLLEGFSQLPAQDFNFKFFGNSPTTALPGSGVAEPFEAPIYSLKEQLNYPGLLRQCDLWHAPHYNIPFFKGNTKLVVTVHDLIHWIYRKDFFTALQATYAETMFRRVAEKADHIIAVSNHTKKDLIEHFQTDPKKISVIYESVGNQCRRETEEQITAFRQKHGLPEHYFLYVGSLKPHKNVQTLLRVVRKLRKENRLRSELVIVGRKDKKYAKEFSDLESLESGGGIHYFPYIEFSDLNQFYSAAISLVHLSLYEGFGLTPLEAMSCGTPVIASNRSSIPEVTGDAAVLVDPLNENEIAQALLEMESDSEMRADLRVKGRERLNCFSWKETARQTLEVYEKVFHS